MNKIEELLQKIIVKAYEVNKNTKHNINVQFGGSTNELNAYYYKDGITSKEHYTEIDTVYLYWENAEGKLQFILKELDKLKKY